MSRRSMKQPKPPIFIWEPNDLSAFESQEAAEKSLETVDVEDGVYTAAYDAQGLLLRFRVIERTRRLLGTVSGGKFTIEPAEEHPTHMADLEAILRKFIAAVGGYSEEWIRTATAEQLIETGSKLAKTK